MAPDMTVDEYPNYERAATMLHSNVLQGNQPKPDTVTHTFHTLKAASLSPGEFEHVWTSARPVANRLLDRDPSIMELVRLKDAAPHEIHAHYSNHPYPGYEEVTAGQVAKHWRAAEAIARRHGRTPNKEEVTRFAAAGYTAEDMMNHYGEG